MLELLLVPFLVGVTNNAMGMRVGGKFIGGGGLAASKEANEVKKQFEKAREEFLKGNGDKDKMNELAKELQEKAPLAGKGKGKKPAEAKNTELPKLSGSEKQVQWAEDLRSEFFGGEIRGVKSASQWIDTMLKLPPESPRDAFEQKLLKSVASNIRTQSDSKWWIENRNQLEPSTFKSTWNLKFATDEMRKKALKESGFVPKRGSLLELYNQIQED